MALNLGRYGSREIMDLQIFNFATKAPLLSMDYATSAQTENTAATVYARGGAGNARRIAWHGDKETKVTIETKIFTMQQLAMLAGEDIVSGSHEVYKREVLKVEDDGTGKKQIKLSKTPVGTNKDVAVFEYVNGILGKGQDVESIAANTLKLAASASIAIGAEVEVYYRQLATDAHKLSFTAKGFPPYVFLVGDTVYADEVSGEMVSAQLQYFKAKLQPNFTIANSPTGDPSSLTLVFDVFPVKVGGVDTLYDMIVHED
ncbi:hypothetical protein [Paenibacillus chitinolyticus]|uniref:hypothetical protein n=1 Tax=Paenibacillus chitinolyticus TaxID=79263 RepID=UPI001C48E365|nr:hypothetical protein [Paenibacillus chitinolyticus]MBV6713976.1 hypothetical protein [Paenibacillus chitinolyticus]